MHTVEITRDHTVGWYAFGQDITQMSAWCRETIGPSFTINNSRRQYNWQNRYIRKSVVPLYTWRFYFRNEQDAILFNLKWAT